VISHLSTRSPELVWRFLWIGKTGPFLKVFTSETAFAGYVGEVRRLCGLSSVEWRFPRLAVGVLA
jgi:hypothetical protein